MPAFQDLNDQFEDSRDAEIAQQRLDELRQSPEKMLRGPELEERMKKWVS